MQSFAERPAAEGVGPVAALLAKRPDVLWQPLPADLTDLVERLDSPHAVVEALRTAALPSLQAAETLQALGARASRQELLAVHAACGGNARMPAEVARALRGHDDRAPFDPRAPAVATRPLPPDAVARESAAAAGAFSGHLTALLDAAARSGLGRLNLGGVGARGLPSPSRIQPLRPVW